MVRSTSGRVQYGTPDRGKQKAPGTAKTLCTAAGCTTVLSVYNRETTCYLHTAPSTRHPLHRD
jgi:hypothetical protein